MKRALPEDLLLVIVAVVLMVLVVGTIWFALRSMPTSNTPCIRWGIAYPNRFYCIERGRQ